jgi:hypothetical protein
VPAGVKGAGQFDEYFKKIIANDPDVQKVIQGVWGTGPRPADTPKGLEKANHAASQQIGQILASKGIKLPDRTFINPRSGAIEGHRGWSGLPTAAKVAIIAAAGVGTGGALAAAGAFGGAAAGAAGSGIGVTTGVPAGLGSVGATGIGLGGASMAGGSGLTGILANAGINAAKTKLQGGSWKSALVNAGVGAATGGVGGKMDWGSLLKQVATNPDTYTSVLGALAKGKQSGREGENAAATSQADFAQKERAAVEAAQLNRGQLDIQQKQQTQGSQNNAFTQALRSSLAMNMKDVSANRPKGVPNISFSGGLRPSALGAEGRKAAGSMNTLAQGKLDAGGDQFDALPPIERTTAPEYTKPGFWENALGVGATAAGTVSGQQSQNKQQEFQNKLLREIMALGPGGQTPAATQSVAPTAQTPTPAPAFQLPTKDPYAGIFDPNKPKPASNVRF